MVGRIGRTPPKSVAQQPTQSSRAETAPPQKRSGWVQQPKKPEKPGWLAKASDAIDAKLGLDKPGTNITLTGVTQADFDKMEGKVRAMEKNERPFTGDELRALQSGKTVSYIIPRNDGLTDQVTAGVIDLPIDAYLKKVPLEEWGANIADYKGGEVKKAGPNQQIERMVLRSPGKDLDMTKVERLSEDRDASGKLTGAQVRWEVLKTDNGTVLGDIGVLRFAPMPGDPSKTLVTWHNAVKYGQAPFNVLPDKVDQALLSHLVPDYFKRTIEHQRATVF